MRRSLSARPLGVVLVVASVIFPLLITPGCGGAAKAQKRAYKADEAVSKERLRLIDDYDRCMRTNQGYAAQQEACERYLRSAEALH